MGIVAVAASSPTRQRIAGAVRWGGSRHRRYGSAPQTAGLIMHRHSGPVQGRTRFSLVRYISVGQADSCAQRGRRVRRRERSAAELERPVLARSLEIACIRAVAVPPAVAVPVSDKGSHPPGDPRNIEGRSRPALGERRAFRQPGVRSRGRPTVVWPTP